jgi:hypothetical protein
MVMESECLRAGHCSLGVEIQITALYHVQKAMWAIHGHNLETDRIDDTSGRLHTQLLHLEDKDRLSLVVNRRACA